MGCWGVSWSGFSIRGVVFSIKSMLMGTILRANLITVTTLDKWKAGFVNSLSAGAIHMY